MDGFGAFLLSDRTLDARAFNIDTDAQVRQNGRVRVGDKKMAVSTPDFANNVADFFGLGEKLSLQGVT